MEIGTKIVRFLHRKERILIVVNIFSGVSSKLYFFFKNTLRKITPLALVKENCQIQ